MFSELIILFLSSILLYISNLRIFLFLGHIYLFSYHVFQLTLTTRLVHLVQQFNFQTLCGHQMPLNIIWLDSRLNELSIESKNTQNGVLTKELCKLQVMKKSETCSTSSSSSSHWCFVIFGLIISSRLYQDIYGWIIDSKGFP